jgi:phosphohistidine phosphatase
MIEIYLIRHGLAGQFGDFEDDSLRPLSEIGLKKTTKVAQRLKELGLQFDVILTSPYARSMETAIILQSIGLSETLETLDDLKPAGNIEFLIEQLQGIRGRVQSVVIVGHEPDLSRLAAQLIFGQSCENLVLKKAGVIGLNAPTNGDLTGQCQLFWLSPPRLLLG